MSRMSVSRSFILLLFDCNKMRISAMAIWIAFRCWDRFHPIQTSVQITPNAVDARVRSIMLVLRFSTMWQIRSRHSLYIAHSDYCYSH